MVGYFGHGVNSIKPGRKTTIFCCYFSCYCVSILFVLSQNVIKRSGFIVKTINYHQLDYAVNIKALLCSHMQKSLYPLLTQPIFKFYIFFSFGVSV